MSELLDRVCIVGDSYADVNGDDLEKSWPNLLKNKANTAVIDAQCGISNWSIYQRFVNQLAKQKYDSVIFLHTNPFRWPNLPHELEGSNWNIHDIDEIDFQFASDAIKLEFLNNFYLDLFPEKFSQYISESIFKDVNNYCKDNDIYLINIMCFDTPYSCKTNFPILHDIDKISHYEKIKFVNKYYTFRELDKKHPLPYGDPRMCHFGDKNNLRVANILTDWLINKPMNIKKTAISDFEWDLYDSSNDVLFEKMIKSDE